MGDEMKITIETDKSVNEIVLNDNLPEDVAALQKAVDEVDALVRRVHSTGEPLHALVILDILKDVVTK